MSLPWLKFVRLFAIVAMTIWVGRAEEGPVKPLLPGGQVMLSAQRKAVARVHLSIKSPYHIYSTLAQLTPQGTGPTPTTVSVRGHEGISLDGPVKTSAAHKEYDPNFDLELLTLEDKSWLDVPLKARHELAAGSYTVKLFIAYQACTEESCLPPLETALEVSIVVPPPVSTPPK